MSNKTIYPTQLITGDKTPLDGKAVVETLEEAENYKYDGYRCYVKSEKKDYSCKEIAGELVLSELSHPAEMIQESNNRSFISESERNNWNNIANDIKGGIYSTLNTLKKLYDHFYNKQKERGDILLDSWSIKRNGNGNKTTITVSKFKTGMVYLKFESNFSIDIQTDTWSNSGSNFVQIPIGFRPKKDIEFKGAGSMETANYSYLSFVLTTNGEFRQADTLKSVSPTHGSAYYMSNLLEEELESFEV